MKFAVDSLAGALSRLADGDVSYRIDQSFAESLDQVRHDFNHSADKLQTALKAVAQNARGIDAGANEIKSAADDLAKRTEQQAAALEETSSALEEITTAVRQSTDRATAATLKVDEARQSTQVSSVVVGDAIAAMQRIEQASGQISQIINVIDEIAFQTNLLALNAGVEAARAGESGKGFAVVAQEVRELAQRSAAAAKEIKDQIARSSAQVEQGVQLVGRTGEALKRISDQIASANDIVSKISHSAQEQDTTLRSISASMNQLDQATQQNAAMAEETTASAEVLANDTGDLLSLIRSFKTSQAGAGQQQYRMAS